MAQQDRLDKVVLSVKSMYKRHIANNNVDKKAYATRMIKRHIHLSVDGKWIAGVVPKYIFIILTSAEYREIGGICRKCLCGDNSPRYLCPNFVVYGADCSDEGSLLGYCENCVDGPHTLMQLCPTFQKEGKSCKYRRRINGG